MACVWHGLCAVMFLAAAPSHAERAAGALCAPAIRDAERAGSIPSDLLTAIGQVESGRRDPRSGATVSWPWTINAEGQGSFFDNSAEAIEAVRLLQARGVRSIDVGCMQVNLQQHPAAFATLADAFDPQINARYAARFLNQLHVESGTWTAATALYHSATPSIAEPYRKRVLALWPNAGQTAQDRLASAWAATLGSAAPVIRIRVRGGRTFEPGRTLVLAGRP